MNTQEAYLAGFVKLCEEQNVDPQELAKFAQQIPGMGLLSKAPALPTGALGQAADIAGANKGRAWSPATAAKTKAQAVGAAGAELADPTGMGRKAVSGQMNMLQRGAKGVASGAKSMLSGAAGKLSGMFGGGAAKPTGRSVSQSTTKQSEAAYGFGFVKFCEDNGVDPEELWKFAKVMAQAPTSAEKADFAAKVKGDKAKKKDPTTQLKSTGAGSGAANIKQKKNVLGQLLAD
jgi:hypothetical protein